MAEAKPQVVRSVAAMRQRVGEWHRAGQTIGLVPTMGALHDGHLALVRAALAGCDRTIVSIFVNPTQFGANEDLAAYPRGEAADLAKLASVGADLAFLPAVAEMYPEGFATKVEVAGQTDILCGVSRPVHFTGVATVVSKLFIQSAADRAYFGEKDFQQLQVVRRMARDLDIPVDVVGVETVREPDGLAMSSRNVYLTAEQRATAPALHRVLREIARRVADGTAASTALAWGHQELAGHAIDRIEYLEVRDAVTLAAVERPTAPARVLVAAHLGTTRLIDNVPVRR